MQHFISTFNIQLVCFTSLKFVLRLDFYEICLYTSVYQYLYTSEDPYGYQSCKSNYEVFTFCILTEHSCILAFLHTCIHANMHSCISAYFHTSILKYMHSPNNITCHLAIWAKSCYCQAQFQSSPSSVQLEIRLALSLTPTPTHPQESRAAA